MSPKPKCPFCLQEFESVDEVIQHLLFDNCQPVQESNTQRGASIHNTDPLPERSQELEAT